MRGILRAITVSVALFSVQIMPLHSQAMKTQHAVVDYIQTEAEATYLELQKKWQPLHQDLVNEGEMVYWGLFEIAYPRGSAQRYNYATIRIYDDLPVIEHTLQENRYQTAYQKNHTGDWAQFRAATTESREVVKGELFEIVSTTGHDYHTMGRFIEMDYMNTPEGGEGIYVTYENTYWKPMQEQRIAQGLMTGWDLWGLKYPSGSGQTYDFATVNFFDTYSDLSAPDYPPEVISGAHPDFTEGRFEILAIETITIRSMVEMQLWIRLDQTTTAD